MTEREKELERERRICPLELRKCLWHTYSKESHTSKLVRTAQRSCQKQSRRKNCPRPGQLCGHKLIASTASSSLTYQGS